MTTQANQRQTRDAWETFAPGFDEFVTPANIRHGEEMLRRVDVQHGTRFLDVAAGSGALSIPAARAGAEVVATDIAQVMIDRLTARARAEGLANIDGRVMDGQDLEFPDDTFDVSASQHGVSMFPDLAGGPAEMARVTRPGGKVLVVAFGALTKAEHFGVLVSAIRAAVPGAAALPAGLVAGLTAEQRDDVRQVLDGILRERSGGEPGAILHTEINIGVGTK